MNALNATYWQERYSTQSTGWDIGHASPSLIDYATLHYDAHKDLRMLIPGCGHGYEVSALFDLGYTHITAMDYSQQALASILERCPGFPDSQLLQGDFFAHQGEYELILEQTFFCALDPSLRKNYVVKMHELLAPGGMLAGLWFNREFEKQGPPFGGSLKEYLALFEERFDVLNVNTSPNSIQSRKGTEVFLEMQKKG